MTRPSRSPHAPVCFLAVLVGVLLAGWCHGQSGSTSFVGRTSFTGGTSFVGGTSISGRTPVTGVEQGGVPVLGHLQVERITAYSNLSLDSLQGSLRTFQFGRRLPQRDQAFIVQGSARVTVNGAPCKEGVHFLMDYRRKQITFFDEIDPQALIQVSYRWLRPEEVRQFNYGGISGAAGAVEDGKLAATVNAEPVLGEGAFFRSGDLKLGLKQLSQAGTSSQPGAPASPSIQARQLSLALGERRQGEAGTSVRLDWAMSESLRSETDPEMRRLARVANAAAPGVRATRSLGSGSRPDEEAGPAADPFSDIARTLALSHQSRALTVEAQVQEIGRQFAAAPQFGYDVHKRGYRTEQINTALALADDGASRATWKRRAIRGQEEGIGGQMVHEERGVRLGSFAYQRNELSLSKDFAPSAELSKQLMGEYGLQNRRHGTAAEGLKVQPHQMAGVRDIQEHWEWTPVRSLQLARDERQITDAQGASLRELQQTATLMGGRLQISQSAFQMSHDFALAPQMGYKNRAGHQGHDLQNLNVTFKPTDSLTLVHSEMKDYANPSGQEGQGTLTVQTENQMGWNLSSRTTLGLSQKSWTVGSQAARAAGDGAQLASTDQRTVSLEHAFSPDTRLKLSDILTRMSRGEEEGSDRKQAWGLDTRLGSAQLHADQLRWMKPDDTRQVDSNYALAMGSLKATYAEVAATGQQHKTRLDVRYEKPLSRSLSLNTRYLRVRNWKEHEKAPEYQSLVATEAALTFKPSERLSLSVWQRARNIEEEARYVDQGIGWEYKVASTLSFSGQLQRTERDTGRHTASKSLAMTLAPHQRVTLEASYNEASDAQGVLRPSHTLKATVQPWTGLSFTGHYTGRDQGEEKGPTTRGYTLAQQLGTGGKFEVTYLDNPVNNKGQVEAYTQESYTLMLPQEWVGDRLSLKGSYSLLDDRRKGTGAAQASAELGWRPSSRDSLQLTYAQNYQYQPNIGAAQGTFTYDLRYARNLGGDQEWGITGQYVGYLGEGLRNRTGRLHDYRIETDFRLIF